MSPLSNHEQKYSLLQDKQEDSSSDLALPEPTQRQKPRLKLVAGLTLLVLALSFGTASLGFYAGSQATLSKHKSNIELDTVPQTFVFNRTFADPPSQATEEAWNEMFPQHGGYFSHPTIAPERSTLSVFHQLHCVVRPSPPLPSPFVRPNPIPPPTSSVFHKTRKKLTNRQTQDMLRLGYYQYHKAATEGRQVSDDDPKMKYTPAHMRHCIDLLRQSFMCLGDTTIEVKEGPRGAKGFGTQHQCRDWKQLVTWTTEWQLND
ncbi:hypothetical protein MMC19_003920 [Ptychographa xylographoides]|nr:hypothetical protein [Ptychographa xylographoides]